MPDSKARVAALRRRSTPASAEVAELAGVSRTTVSFVLNDVRSMNISEATRQKVFDAAPPWATSRTRPRAAWPAAAPARWRC